MRAFRSISSEEYLNTIKVNLKSVIIIGEMAAKMMADHGGGDIINISSICASSRNHYYTPYGLSKTGVVAFTKLLADKYMDKGVSVRSIAPGSVATVMNHSKAGDNIASMRPLRHVVMPEQIAALVAFYLSDVGKYLQNGEVIKACATEQV